MKRCLILCLLLAGCSTPKPTAQYPVTEIRDPVTERTPDVILP